jgi:hypothetical protein
MAPGAGAAVINEAGHQPFAGAGLALQQDGGDGGMAHGVEARQVPDLGAQGLKGWGRTHETVEGVGGDNERARAMGTSGVRPGYAICLLETSGRKRLKSAAETAEIG